MQWEEASLHRNIPEATCTPVLLFNCAKLHEADALNPETFTALFQVAGVCKDVAPPSTLMLVGPEVKQAVWPDDSFTAHRTSSSWGHSERARNMCMARFGNPASLGASCTIRMY